MLTQKMRVALLTHFQTGVPIDRLNLSPQQKDIVARVEHVYWQWVKNPFLDCYMLLYQLHKNAGKGTGGTSTILARRDMKVFEFVRDNITSSSRKVDEQRVRAAANKAIRIGMETDDVNALTRGGKLLYDVAHLGQPESEQADMSRLSFLPPVVTTSAKEVDETKEEVDDQEMKRIMAKYGGFVDEKEEGIEKMVEVMAARGMPPKECDGDAREGVAD